MAHGLDHMSVPEPRWRIGRDSGSKPRSYLTGKNPNNSKPTGFQGNTKPPCTFCGHAGHGIWSCQRFQQIPLSERWKTAKEKKLCFRCLADNHHGKDCRRFQQCNVGGCRRTHHRLLHDPEHNGKPKPPVAATEDKPPTSPGKGVKSNPDSYCNTTTYTSACKGEMNSLRTIPVWVKGKGKSVKVNAVLDDASNETFLNEEVAGFLGMKAERQQLQVHVLNDSIETFNSMPLQIEIESVDRQFTKEINVRTCPREVTGN